MGARCRMDWYHPGFNGPVQSEHDSIREAMWVFEDRTDDRAFPCVTTATPDEGGPSALLFFLDDEGNAGEYPDRELHYGPRGGLRCSLT